VSRRDAGFVRVEVGLDQIGDTGRTAQFIAAERGQRRPQPDDLGEGDLAIGQRLRNPAQRREDGFAIMFSATECCHERADLRAVGTAITARHASNQNAPWAELHALDVDR
jgi:hypothetical protein